MKSKTQPKKRKDRAPRKNRITGKAVKKGLLIVYTGDGKGKTTAALGAIFRALGYKWRVGVVQFIKGAWKTGEAVFAREFQDRIDFFAMGDGFTWNTQNFDQDVASAQKAWKKCVELLHDKRYRLVIFDELNYVIKYNFLDVQDIIDALKKRLPDTHVIITGRNASLRLIQSADLVTEMRLVKHPYQQGIKAQPGIDY